MYLGWIDYGVLVILLIVSGAIGIYQGCIRSKQISATEFLVADGRMKILPTALSLLASMNSAVALLGTPVEIYYYGTMFFYCIFSWLIATYLTMKFFIPKFHYIGSASIYAYLEQRFSLTIRILVTCSFVFVTILYMSIVLYGPSLALSQVTGLNIWISVGSCGLVCTIYTSIGGMKAVIWTDVIQACIMFLGLILSIIFGLIDVGGIFQAYEMEIDSNFHIILNPSVRYTIWSMLIGRTFSFTAQAACNQTQAQRYMCVKDCKSAQKVAWINYPMIALMDLLCVIVGCVIYVKYSQCDPLRAKIISRSDQLYPLFVTETLGRIPGLTGLFIACIFSATLSTFSSGVNSIATVIVEDVYKRLSNQHSTTNQRQIILSKVLSVVVGCLAIIIAFVVSHMKSNIITIILQIFGVFAAPILAVYLLGLFSSRVKSRSATVAFFLSLIFQLFMFIGSNLIVASSEKHGGRLPTSVAGCVPSVVVSSPMTTDTNSNVFVSIFSISPLWFTFNGTMITVVLGMILTFILDSKDSKLIDPLLLISRYEIFPCLSSTKKTIEQPITQEDDGTLKNNAILEQESML